MTVHSQPGQALTFAYDYDPGTSFQVVARLPQNVVARILGRQVDGEPVIRDTADYDAYLANYRLQGDSPGEYILVFVDGALQDDQQYTFDTGAVFFASRLNLIEVGLSASEGTPTPEEGGSDGGKGGEGGGGGG